jgi:cytochrome c biogenesis protein CcdA
VTELLLVLTPIALVDSTSMLPLGIPVLVAMLGARGGERSCAAFLAGIFAVYFPFGVVLAVGFGAVLDRIQDDVQRWASTPPGALDLGIQLMIGLTLLAFGWKLAVAREKRKERAPAKPLLPSASFSLGAGLMLVGMPGAVPYFAAVDQLLRADVSVTGGVLAMLFYNAVFLLPLAAVPVLRILLRERSQPIFDAVNRFLEIWGRRIVTAILLGLGGVLVADAVGWFLGRPVLPVPPPPPPRAG